MSAGYSTEEGWTHMGDHFPFWHYVPRGTDKALCGDIWLEYGQPRPPMESHENLMPHTADCKRCAELRGVQLK